MVIFPAGDCKSYYCVFIIQRSTREEKKGGNSLAEPSFSSREIEKEELKRLLKMKFSSEI